MAFMYPHHFIIIYGFYIILIGTITAYTLYNFFYKNQINNILKNDLIFNLIKCILLLSLVVSFLLLLVFIIFLEIFTKLAQNYVIFNDYNIFLSQNFLTSNTYALHFSTDLFGNILLFLAYFIGILSLLALDNRIF